MALPWLPQSDIFATYPSLEAQAFELSDTDNELIEILKKYIKYNLDIGRKKFDCLYCRYYNE